MKIKLLLLVLIGMISVSASCFAQSREPGSTGESSSTGVWPSVGSGSSAGYGSGDHGNVS